MDTDQDKVWNDVVRQGSSMDSTKFGKKVANTLFPINDDNQMDTEDVGPIKRKLSKILPYTLPEIENSIKSREVKRLKTKSKPSLKPKPIGRPRNYVDSKEKCMRVDQLFNSNYQKGTLKKGCSHLCGRPDKDLITCV